MPNKKGRLSVWVFDALTLEAVVATLTIKGPGLPTTGLKTLTDADGSYSTRLLIGDYIVDANAAKYIAQSSAATIIFRATTELSFALAPSTTNLPPVIDSIGVEPAIVGAGGTAVITVTAHDPEGNPLSYEAQIIEGGGSLLAGPQVHQFTYTAP